MLTVQFDLVIVVDQYDNVSPEIDHFRCVER